MTALLSRDTSRRGARATASLERTRLRCLRRSCEIPLGGLLKRLRCSCMRDCVACVALARHLQEGRSSDCVALARATVSLTPPPCPCLRRKEPWRLRCRADPTTAFSAQATASLSCNAISTTLTFTCSENKEQRVSSLFEQQPTELTWPRSCATRPERSRERRLPWQSATELLSRGRSRNCVALALLVQKADATALNLKETPLVSGTPHWSRL